MMGMFESCKVPIICWLTHLRKKEIIKDKNWLSLAHDLIQAEYSQLNNFSREFIFPVANFGRFYPDVFANPNKFI